MFERKVDPNRKTRQAVNEIQKAKIIGEDKMRDGKVTKSRIFSSSSFAVLGFATSEETCKPGRVITNVRNSFTLSAVFNNSLQLLVFQS